MGSEKSDAARRAYCSTRPEGVSRAAGTARLLPEWKHKVTSGNLWRDRPSQERSKRRHQIPQHRTRKGQGHQLASRSPTIRMSTGHRCFAATCLWKVSTTMGTMLSLASSADPESDFPEYSIGMGGSSPPARRGLALHTLFTQPLTGGLFILWPFRGDKSDGATAGNAKALVR